MFFKDDQFRNNPPSLGIRGFDQQRHVYDCDRPEMVDLIKEIRTILDGYPERYAVGETFLGTTKAAFYSGDDLLHAAFNFDLLHGSFSIPRFSQAIQRWEKATSGKTWPVQVLNNHDTKRTASKWVHGEKDDRLKLLAAMLLTIRGTPFLYYGEEIGMRDIHVSRSMIKDPIGKRYWPFVVGRDGCRAPMQWNQEKNAGFSKGDPWLPVHPDFKFRNVDAQKADPNSLYHFYQKLIHLRKEHEALRGGMYQPLTFEPRFVLAFLRQTAEETILVAMNSSRRPMRLFLGGNLARSSWDLLLSSHREEVPDTSRGYIWLSSNEVVILKQK
jgi:alpha-glucosidase